MDRDKLIEERRSAKDSISLIATTMILFLLGGSLHPFFIVVGICSLVYNFHKVSKLSKAIAEIDSQINNDNLK